MLTDFAAISTLELDAFLAHQLPLANVATCHLAVAKISAILHSLSPQPVKCGCSWTGVISQQGASYFVGESEKEKDSKTER